MHVSKECEIRKQLSVSLGGCNPVSNIICSGKRAGRVRSLLKSMGSISTEEDPPTSIVRTHCLVQTLMEWSNLSIHMQTGGGWAETSATETSIQLQWLEKCHLPSCKHNENSICIPIPWFWVNLPVACDFWGAIDWIQARQLVKAHSEWVILLSISFFLSNTKGQMDSRALI